MPRLVRDIVRTLHPYTNMQQKAAAKVDGSRIFIIGYSDGPSYRVSSALDQHKQMPPILLSRLALTFGKAYIAFMNADLIKICLCATGVLLMPLQLRQFKNLLKDRRLLYVQLKYRADETLK